MNARAHTLMTSQSSAKRRLRTTSRRHPLSLTTCRSMTSGQVSSVCKCFFGQDSLECLGHQIAHDGVQPQPKNVEATQKIESPKNVHQLRCFLGMVNCHHDAWKHRSHVLALLAEPTGKEAKWEWDTLQENAFEETKQAMAKETILACPDFDEPFHIHDASDCQPGAVIVTKHEQEWTTGQSHPIHDVTRLDSQLVSPTSTIVVCTTVEVAG